MTGMTELEALTVAKACIRIAQDLVDRVWSKLRPQARTLERAVEAVREELRIEALCPVLIEERLSDRQRIQIAAILDAEITALLADLVDEDLADRAHDGQVAWPLVELN